MAEQVKVDVAAQAKNIAAAAQSKSTTPPPAAQKPAVKEESKNVFKEDSWMYHPKHEPKLFKKGEPLPGGEWSEKNTWKWYRDINNNLNWRKK